MGGSQRDPETPPAAGPGPDTAHAGARASRLDVVFEHLADAVFLLEVEPGGGYRFAEANASFLGITGCARERVVGARLEAVIAPSALPIVLAHCDEAVRLGRRVQWEQATPGGGEDRFSEVTVVPVHDADGRCTGLVGTVHDVSERRANEARLDRLANFDALTGLPNRHHLHACVQREVEVALRSGRTVALLYLDLDHFKHVNDTLGHACGDELLRQVGRRVLDCTRVRDTVGRLGGDEFGIVAELENPSQDDAAALARKLLAALMQPFVLDGHEVVMTPSIGIALCPPDGCDVDALMRHADTAMYHAKAAGRNRYRFYTPEMNRHAEHRRDLEAALRLALWRNEFELHYQPQVDLRTGAWTGAEALLRWARPGHGLVPPAQFVPLLEETGLIEPVGHWIVQSACRQLAEWQREGFDDFRVSVNLSARQLAPQFRRGLDAAAVRESAEASDAMRDPAGEAGDRTCSSIERCLRDYGVAPGTLEVELTETALMAHVARTGPLLERLRALGVKVLVDDFGTGYSSLVYLKRFPIDTLKIDHEFIRDLDADAEDSAITCAIINLAHTLNLNVIAEGVEHAHQAEFLRRQGCHVVQGFHFSRPIPAARLTEHLRARRDMPPAH